jgi:hypothetical protein
MTDAEIILPPVKPLSRSSNVIIIVAVGALCFLLGWQSSEIRRMNQYDADMNSETDTMSDAAGLPRLPPIGTMPGKHRPQNASKTTQPAE